MDQYFGENPRYLNMLATAEEHYQREQSEVATLLASRGMLD